jgi:NAD-dependent deacetylase
LDKAIQAARTCDLFLSIGTSTVVHPAASLPYEALDRGGMLIEVNPEITPLTGNAHHSFHDPPALFCQRY